MNIKVIDSYTLPEPGMEFHLETDSEGDGDEYTMVNVIDSREEDEANTNDGISDTTRTIIEEEETAQTQRKPRNRSFLTAVKLTRKKVRRSVGCQRRIRD